MIDSNNSENKLKEQNGEAGNQHKKTFDNFDKLKLKDCGENLFKVMEQELKSSVGEEMSRTISLNADFGNGKTTFLEMFENFINDEKKNYNVLFINAWESDFYKEPVIAILSELLNFVEQDSSMQDRLKKKFFDAIPNMLNQTIKAGLGFDAKDAFKTGENFLIDFNKRKKAIRETREVISEFTAKKKLLIIIDELDRARPDYAVSFLEDMKHFFDIKNVIFLVAVNKKQMESTIRCLYGDRTDFDGYYRKFFKYEMNLLDPYRNVQKIIKSIMDKMQVVSDNNYGFATSYEACKMFALTLREIEYFLGIFELIVKREGIQCISCLSFFICLSIKEKGIFQKVSNKKFTIEDFFEFLDDRELDFSYNLKFLLARVSYSLIEERKLEHHRGQIIGKFPLEDHDFINSAICAGCEASKFCEIIK